MLNLGQDFIVTLPGMPLVPYSYDLLSFCFKPICLTHIHPHRNHNQANPCSHSCCPISSRIWRLGQSPGYRCLMALPVELGKEYHHYSECFSNLVGCDLIAPIHWTSDFAELYCCFEYYFRLLPEWHPLKGAGPPLVFKEDSPAFYFDHLQLSPLCLIFHYVSLKDLKFCSLPFLSYDWATLGFSLISSRSI